MSGCADCSGCKSGCSGCGGCPGAGSLELTQPEVEFLRLLGQVVFLPIAGGWGTRHRCAWKMDSRMPRRPLGCC